MSELWTVRTRSVKDLRPDPLDLVPGLVEIAEQVFGVNVDKSKRDKIIVVVSAALSRMSSDNQRRAAGRLFDLGGGYVVIPLTRRLRSAAEELKPGMSAETFTDNRDKSGRHERSLLLTLSEIILGLRQEFRGDRPTLKTAISARFGSIGEPSFVERPAVARAFNQAVSAGAPIIQLVGDVGNGKTRLARELCLRAADQDRSQVFEISGRTDMLTPYEVLRHARYPNVDLARMSTWDIHVQFDDFFRSAQAPRFVLIDDVTNLDVVQIFNRSGMRSIIAITGTELFDGPHVIRVPPMDEAEARALVNHLLAGATDDEVSDLITGAGSRPRFIVEGCRMLAEKRFATAKEVAQSLQLAPRLFFELAEPAWQERATTYYAKLLERLRVEHPTAGLLVELLGIYKHDVAKPKIFEQMLGALIGAPSESLRTSLFNEAVFRLAAHSILSEVSGEYLRVNVLTGLILRDILEAADNSLRDRVHAVIYHGLKRSSSNGDTSSFSDWRMMWYGFSPDRGDFLDGKWAQFPHHLDPAGPEWHEDRLELSTHYRGDQIRMLVQRFTDSVQQLRKDMDDVERTLGEVG